MYSDSVDQKSSKSNHATLGYKRVIIRSCFETDIGYGLYIVNVCYQSIHCFRLLVVALIYSILDIGLYQFYSHTIFLVKSLWKQNRIEAYSRHNKFCVRVLMNALSFLIYALLF